MGCWVARQLGTTTSSYTVLCVLLPGAGASGAGGVPRSASCALRGPVVLGPNGRFLLTLTFQRVSLYFRPGIVFLIPSYLLWVPLLGFLRPLSGRLVPAMSWQLAYMALSLSLLWSFFAA